MTENGPKGHTSAVLDIKSGKKNVLYVSRDITERKDFEQALVASEKKYRYLAENMRDAVWIMDLNWKHIYCSPAIQKIRGFTPEEVTELSIEKQMTPESLANALKLKEYGLTTGGTQSRRHSAQGFIRAGGILQGRLDGFHRRLRIDDVR